MARTSPPKTTKAKRHLKLHRFACACACACACAYPVRVRPYACARACACVHADVLVGPFPVQYMGNDEVAKLLRSAQQRTRKFVLKSEALASTILHLFTIPFGARFAHVCPRIGLHVRDQTTLWRPK